MSKLLSYNGYGDVSFKTVLNFRDVLFPCRSKWSKRALRTVNGFTGRRVPCLGVSHCI